jgi:tRNA pseudouridine13 synthase
VKPVAQIRSSPQDFVVDEIPAYEPSGQGEHLFLRIRKTGLTSIECANRLGRALQAAPRDIGIAGMKDRHAVTTQHFSVPFALARSTDEALGLQLPDIEVLSAIRHEHKLRTGHVRANQFRIVLRGLGPSSLEPVAHQLEATMTSGVPNRYGPQRFGRDGNNPDRALHWVIGKGPGPRDPRQRNLLLSSLQAMLFDEVLGRREADGTWCKVLLGDVAKRHDTGGLFECTDEAVDGPRAQQAEISATGPIFGAKMRWPGGSVEQLEREVLTQRLGADEQVWAKLGSGSRRPLRFFPEGLNVSPLPGNDGALVVEFKLPKGCYATTLLQVACLLEDASRNQERASNETQSSCNDELSRDSGAESE